MVTLFSSSKLQAKFLISLVAVLIACANIIVAPNSVSHAQSSSVGSSVFIAVDATSPTCHMKRTVRSYDTNTLLRISDTSCPPGTVISTMKVSLAEAQAKHEIYSSAPADHTAQTLQKWNKQVRQLIQSKNKSIQAGLLQATPQTICTDGNTSQSLDFEDVYLPRDHTGAHTGLFFGLYYHVLTNCNYVVLDDYGVSGDTPVVQSAYFNGVAYNGTEYHDWCLFPNGGGFIGDLGWTYYPGVQVSYEHNAEWDISEDSCLNGSSTAGYFAAVY